MKRMLMIANKYGYSYLLTLFWFFFRRLA